MAYEPLWTADDPPMQGLGLMRLRSEGSDDPDRVPNRLIGVAAEAGVTMMDTAEMYGNEELVGRAVAAVREQITLCSKFGVYWGESGRHDDWSVRADPATVRSSIEGSLRRLNTDVIDLYYLHHRSEETPIEETVGAMAELLTAGKIRAIGLSNVTVEDVRRAHAVHPIHAVQEQWSLSERGVEAMMPALAELGITLVAHSPLGHGSLVGTSSDPTAVVLREIAQEHGLTTGQVALAWVHNQGRAAGHSVVPLPGTTRVSHLLDNIAVARLDLPASAIDRINAVWTDEATTADR